MTGPHRALLDEPEVTLLEALPRSGWHRISNGHWTARLMADPNQMTTRSAVPVLWRLFHTAADSLGVDRASLAWLEIAAVKRQTAGGVCSIHTDVEQPASRGRVLSMSVGLSPQDRHEGGVLKVAGGHRLRLDRGQVAIFPADARHGVTKVTSGERLTLVARVLDETGSAAGQWLFNPAGAGRKSSRVTERDIAAARRYSNRPRRAR